MTVPFFDGAIAVITGASRGIGAATAVRLGAMGAQCVLIARTVGGLEATDDAIRKAGGKPASLVPLDLGTDHGKIDALGAELHQRYGRVDVLVAAAAKLDTLSPVGHISPKAWDECFDLNLTANYRILRSFDPLFRQSPLARAAFLTCAAAHESQPFWAAYAASKIALEKLVAVYAAENAARPIRAFCVDPGPASTRLRRDAFPGTPADSLPTADEAAAKVIEALLRQE